MKLGVSYNLFDAIEHLEPSIKCIRDHVDYISVVWQDISNFGNKSSVNIEKILNDLKERKLIDTHFKFIPNTNTIPQHNEIDKRNLGLHISQANSCTHHMSMDTDEYYLSDEFISMKNDVEFNNYDSSACQMMTYYKSPEYVLDPPEEYYVPLIYKIRPGIRFVLGIQFPVLVDPTRRMDSGNCKIYNRDYIQMHHMTGIRNNYREKLVNSSSSHDFKSKIDELVSEYNNWEYPNKVMLPGTPFRYSNIKKVKNLFT